MKKELDSMFKLLPTLTQEEADFIEKICKWNDVERGAFLIAKRMF